MLELQPLYNKHNEYLCVYGIEVKGHETDGKTIVFFKADKRKERDEDGDNDQEIVLFHIAYEVSTHKVQSLEYDLVKIVITKEIDKEF